VVKNLTPTTFKVLSSHRKCPNSLSWTNLSDFQSKTTTSFEGSKHSSRFNKISIEISSRIFVEKLTHELSLIHIIKNLFPWSNNFPQPHALWFPRPKFLQHRLHNHLHPYRPLLFRLFMDLLQLPQDLGSQ